MQKTSNWTTSQVLIKMMMTAMIIILSTQTIGKIFQSEPTSKIRFMNPTYRKNPSEIYRINAIRCIELV